MKKSWVIWTTITILSGCNGLFYHPDQIVYTDPTVTGQVVEPFSLEGRDGETLSGWYLPTKWQRHGLVLHFHGNAQNMTAHVLFSFWLVDAGYDVIVFDYRGYGASTGSPSREGMVHDAMDVLEHVQDRYYRTGDDFIVFAQSLGAAIAIPALTLVQRPSPDALIVDSTFASYRGIAQDKLGSFFLTWPLQWPLSFLVSDDFSPIDYADKINVPVLMVHGTKDDVTAIKDAKNLFDNFKTPDKTLWVVPGGYHTSAFYEGSPYQTKLLEFLCEKSSRSKLCHANRSKFEQRYEERKNRTINRPSTSSESNR